MVEINLLPPQYRKRTEPNVWLYASLGAAAVTLLSSPFPKSWWPPSVGNLQRRLDDNKGQISALQSSVTPEYQALTTSKTNLTAISQTAQSLSSGKTYWSTDLAKFVGQLPQSGGVALSRLEMRAPDAQSLYNGKAASKEFELTGTAASTTALVNFLNAYDQDSYGVNFKNTQRDPLTSNYNFAATVGQLGGVPVSAAATTPVGTAPAAPASGGN